MEIKISQEGPCQFFDKKTLEYYIETNRDGLAITAKKEWFYRWGVEYPYVKGTKGEIL